VDEVDKSIFDLIVLVGTLCVGKSLFGVLEKLYFKRLIMSKQNNA